LLDRLLAAAPPPPVTIEAEVAEYRVGILIGGYIMPLKVKLDASSAGAAQPDGQPPRTTAATPSPTTAGRP
jgi:hypothetical protein